MFSRLFGKHYEPAQDCSARCPSCYCEFMSSAATLDILCPNCHAVFNESKTHPFELLEVSDGGAALAETLAERIAGVSHTHANSNPQETIPTLTPGVRLYMVPDYENPYDPQSIKLYTIDHKQIGWYPKSGWKKDLIWRYLTERLPIRAYLYEVYQNPHSRLWEGRVQVALYETYLCESAAKREAREASKELKSKLTAAARKAHEALTIIPDVFKPYYDELVKILEAHALETAYLTPSVTDKYFIVFLGSSPKVLTLNYKAKRPYLLIYAPPAELLSQLQFETEYSPAPKSESIDSIRLFISSPDELHKYSDFICSRYSSQLQHYISQ